MSHKNIIILSVLSAVSIAALAMQDKENFELPELPQENSSSAIVVTTKVPFPYEGCGICQQIGEEVFWFTRKTRYAHRNCVEIIENAEKDILKKVDTLFNKYKRTNVLIEIREAVQEACEKQGEPTIKSYLEKKGEGELKKLYDTVGHGALENFCEWQARKAEREAQEDKWVKKFIQFLDAEVAKEEIECPAKI